MVPDRSVAASASAAASMSLAVFCSALIASDISGTGFETWDYETSWDILISNIPFIFISYFYRFFHLQFGTKSAAAVLFFAGEAFSIGLTQARILRERSRFCKVSALRKVLLCRWRLDMTTTYCDDDTMTNMTTQHAVIRCDTLSIERPAQRNRSTLAGCWSSSM